VDGHQNIFSSKIQSEKASPSYLATASINRRRPLIGAKIYVAFLPIQREDLFYANYVEKVLEKLVGSISTMNHDKMIVHKGANHGIGTFENTPTKA
jgi:hypothetical protein